MDDNGIPDGWHRFPKDDAWKKCTLRGLVENGERLWLYCAGCRRTRYLEIVQWAETHGVDLDWPLLTFARRIRCSRCNRKAASLRAQPYRNQPERDETVPDGIEACPLCGSRKIEKSGAIVRPINWERLRDQFMFGFVMAECECECSQCWNWWSQPVGFSIIEHLTAITVRRTPRRRLDLSQSCVGPSRQSKEKSTLLCV
jgi:hypothetical protein